jgi:hypothetical protein
MLNITAVAKKRVVTTPPPRLQYGADEFIGWFYEVADSGFTEATVSASRAWLSQTSWRRTICLRHHRCAARPARRCIVD